MVCATCAVNKLASRGRATSLWMWRKEILAFNGWAIAVAGALSLAGGAAPEASQLAYPQQPTYAAPPQADAWTTYKQRLAILARQQGVAQATISANVPSLTI